MKLRLVLRIATLVLALAMLACAAHAEGAVDTQKLDTYYSLAVNYIAREDYDKAMQYLDACLDYCDESSNAELCADIHLKKGCVYTMQTDYPAAIEELDAAIGIQPDLAEAWLVKTQVYSDTAAYADAIESLEKYIELSGDNTMGETLAQLYRQNGEAEKALESYQAYLDANGAEGAESTYLLGVYKMDMTQYAAAAEDFEGCLDDENYGVSAAYNAGVCRMNLSDYAAALEDFKRCVDSADQFDGLHYNMGVCSMSLQDYESAVNSFTASVETESYKTDATYNRAICQMSLGNYQPAIEDFTAYLDAQTAAAAEAEAPAETEETEEPAEGEAPAETEETEAPAETEKTEETEETGEAGDGLLPQLDQPAKQYVDVATYYRGVCWLSIDEYDKAAEDFTACMENGVVPEDSRFNRALSYLQGGRYEEAKADFTECIESGSNVDEALFYRSYAFRYLEDNQSALDDLTACIEHGYNLSQSYYQRAQVYSAMGDDDHYVEDLETSLNY